MVASSKRRPVLKPAVEIPEYGGVFPPALFIVRPPRGRLEDIIVTESRAHHEVQSGIASALARAADVRYLSTNSIHLSTGFYPDGKELMLHVGGASPPVEENHLANFAMRELSNPPLYFAKQGRQLPLEGAVKVIASMANNQRAGYMLVIVGQEVPKGQLTYLKEGLASYGKPKDRSPDFVPRHTWRRHNLKYSTNQHGIVILPRAPQINELVLSQGAGSDTYIVRNPLLGNGSQIIVAGTAEFIAGELVGQLDGSAGIRLSYEKGIPPHDLNNYFILRLNKLGQVVNPNLPSAVQLQSQASSPSDSTTSSGLNGVRSS